MPIDLQRDELLSFRQLAARLPSVQGTNNKVHPATVHRWATAGVKGHKLETVRVIGRRVTTWQAYVEFATAVQGGAAPSAPTPGALSPNKARRVKDATRVLAAAGIA